MPQDGDYTVASLKEGLESIKDPLDAVAQEAFELSKASGPGREADDQVDAYHGLWRELHELTMAIEGCLSRLKDPNREAKSAVIQRSPPILDSCKALADSLTDSTLETISLETILEAKSKALWFQRTIANGASWTDTQNGLLFYMSLLPAEPPRDFQALGVPAGQIRRWRSLRKGKPSAEVDADIVSYWLTLLNADFNDREPEEYYREKIFIELRNQAIPDYSKAAVQWPRYAGQFWTVLRPQIFSLFNSSKSSNFVQWCLEFARGTYSPIFGAQSSSAGAILDLTDYLCSGAISPLHIACAFGLPNLCRDLISSGSDINRSGPFGTPLLCSLVGRSIFEYRFRCGYDLPVDSAIYGKKDRVETIMLLLDAGADCRYRYHVPGDGRTRGCSIMGPAFWAALATENDDILRRVNAGGARFDETITEFVWDLGLEKHCSEHKEFASRLFTYLFDIYLKKDPSLSEGEADGIQHIMERAGLSFSCANGREKVEGIPDDEMDTLTASMMTLDWAFGLRRLVLDPRFDPNKKSNKVGCVDSLLHTAVAADIQDTVEVLLSVGADLHAVGENGRTPVMLVESTEMLEKLVFKYGATTRDIDESGRNLWHYAAATNDMELLTWLCEKDPCKSYNMRAVSDKGRTPLAEAFFFIESLVNQPVRDRSPVEPLTARKLLQEWDDSLPLKSPVPLTHLAAAWSDLELINGLEALGANFLQLDKDGRTALHYLNFSVSAEVVRRLQELCAGAPIDFEEGPTPAETIFLNFSPQFEDRHPKLSAHPSCRQSLSEEAYSLLLSRVKMDVLDYRDRCFWQRFCENVFGSAPPDRVRRISLLGKSIAIAFKCIIQAGALRAYENATGEAAVMCFWRMESITSSSEDEIWNVQYFGPFILAVLEHCGPFYLRKFYTLPAAVELLDEAVAAQVGPLVRKLCSGGVSVMGIVDGCATMDPPLRRALAFCPDRAIIGELLKHVTAEQLTKEGHTLFLALLRVDDARARAEKLEMLLRKGMDPNYMPPSETRSMLGQAAGYPEMARVLLEHGADPRIGSRGGNAAFCAVVVGNKATLLEIIGRVGQDFPWTELRGGEDNVLMAALDRPNEEVLEVLLEQTNLKSHINDMDAGETVAHRAASRGFPENLRVLVRHGADLTIRDMDGQTPLHAACITQFINHDMRTPEDEIPSFPECIEFLAEKEPRAAMMKDKNGKTPFDGAAGWGAEEYIAALKRGLAVNNGEGKESVLEG